MKIISAIAILLACAALATADSVRLATGKYVYGRVLVFTNNTFFVEAEDHSVSKLPLDTVQTVDFESDNSDSTLETKTPASIKGKISIFNKGNLSIEDANGEVTKLPIAKVVYVSFNGATLPGEAPKPDAVKKDSPPKEPAVKKIDYIQDKSLDKYLVRGKVTIVDFYADWCGPCRSIGPHLEDLANQDDQVVLRKVNVDKNSELASEFGIRAIPNIIIYDKTGKNIGTVRGADPEGVDRLVGQAKASGN